MPREIHRVALTFDWPLKTPWPGYINPYRITCHVCEGSGENCAHGVWDRDNDWHIEPYFADEYRAWQRREPPAGEGWQLWQTTGPDSPVSPVFGTVDKLCEWMKSNDYNDWAIESVRSGRTWLPDGFAMLRNYTDTGAVDRIILGM